ncbi:MAG: hypothetical protein ABIK47_00435 [candidate division WOR-3 bacterium]
MRESELDLILAKAREHIGQKVEAIDKEKLFVRVKARLQEPAQKRLILRLKRFEENPKALRLTDRKDLLLLLLYAPGRTQRYAEPLLGMTRITKLLFIALKELNLGKLIRKPYQFAPYKLGPFSPELYDDLEILMQAKLLRCYEIDPAGMPVVKTDAETIKLLTALNSGVKTAERLDAGQLLFELTPRGRRFARALFQIASRKKKNLAAGLKIIKAQFGSLPLTQLLRYVYRRYPEYTTKSEIIDRIIGKTHQSD